MILVSSKHCQCLSCRVQEDFFFFQSWDKNSTSLQAIEWKWMFLGHRFVRVKLPDLVYHKALIIQDQFLTPKLPIFCLFLFQHQEQALVLWVRYFGNLLGHLQEAPWLSGGWGKLFHTYYLSYIKVLQIEKEQLIISCEFLLVKTDLLRRQQLFRAFWPPHSHTESSESVSLTFKLTTCWCGKAVCTLSHPVSHRTTLHCNGNYPCATLPCVISSVNEDGTSLLESLSTWRSLLISVGHMMGSFKKKEKKEGSQSEIKTALVCLIVSCIFACGHFSRKLPNPTAVA